MMARPTIPASLSFASALLVLRMPLRIRLCLPASRGLRRRLLRVMWLRLINCVRSLRLRFCSGGLLLTRVCAELEVEGGRGAGGLHCDELTREGEKQATDMGKLDSIIEEMNTFTNRAPSLKFPL